MNDILKHYKSLPRTHLQRELRRITQDQKLYLWEFVGIGWIPVAVRAGPQTAAKLGVNVGDVIGYHVEEGHVFGGAMGDLVNVEATVPPYPDPFS